MEKKKQHKASGGDGIPVELYQILKDDAVKVLPSICQQIWEIQHWPQDWKRSVFIPIPKKGSPKECSNYCTIALISHASKVILSPGAVSLIPSAVPASVSARASWVHLLSFPGSWSLAVTLPVDVNHPESEEVFG